MMDKTGVGMIRTSATNESAARNQTLFGHLDAIASSGFIDGWAADLSSFGVPVTVSVKKGDQEVAWGIANQYRQDLADARCGTGWCSFRLRTEVPIGQLRNSRLILEDRRTQQMIHESAAIPVFMDGDPEIGSVTELLDRDPTILNAIPQLRACEPIFRHFISEFGAERFVCMAYAYVLQRPPDDRGLSLYVSHLNSASLTPFQIIEALAGSQEFVDRRPQLSAPITPAFPFFV